LVLAIDAEKVEEGNGGADAGLGDKANLLAGGVDVTGVVGVDFEVDLGHCLIADSLGAGIVHCRRV